MGCGSSKPKAFEDGVGTSRIGVPSKKLSPTTSSSRREPSTANQLMSRSVSKRLLIDRKTSSSNRLCEDRFEKSRVKPEEGVLVHKSDIRLVPKAREGEQIAAGWPCWLAMAAGEAIDGWIPRRADTFERLEKVCIFFESINIFMFIIIILWFILAQHGGYRRIRSDVNNFKFFYVIYALHGFEPWSLIYYLILL